MPICNNCNTTWSWLSSIKRAFTITNSAKCPHCNETQFFTAKTRKLGMFGALISPILIAVLNIVFESFSTVVSLSLFAILVILILAPKYIQLTNEEEPIW